MVTVSVVIPSYNHGPYLAEAVSSVLTQSMTDLELIVVDDGSTDNSLAVLADFSDPRLHVISQANQGAHAAINRGMAAATGRILSILNSDDAYEPDRLARLSAILDTHPEVGLVGSYIRVVNAEGQQLGVKHGFRDLEPWLLDHPERSFRAGTDLRAALLAENYWATTSNFVFSRRWWEQVGPFRPLRYAHDWDFALRMAGLAELRLVAEPLLRYRVHANNTIRENRSAMVFEICWVLAVHLPPHLCSPWFAGLQAATGVQQLMHSLYTYDCDRVLCVMLATRLAERPDIAERLLEPTNPERLAYLRYIEERLARRDGTAPARGLRTVRRVALRTRRLFGR